MLRKPGDEESRLASPAVSNVSPSPKCFTDKIPTPQVHSINSCVKVVQEKEC